jgi:antitoxin HigA-1
LVLSVFDAVENIEEMDQPTFHLHALKDDLSLKEAAMRMKNPAHPGELVAVNLKELGLSVAEAAKAIGVTRQQDYNVINGRSAVTPKMAVRFEKAFGGGADVWLRMQAAHDLAKVRQGQEKSLCAVSRGRGDLGHFRPAVVEGIADCTAIETSRKLLTAITKRRFAIGTRNRLQRGENVLIADHSEARSICRIAGDYIGLPKHGQTPITRARCSSRFSTLVDTKPILGNLATLRKTSLHK